MFAKPIDRWVAENTSSALLMVVVLAGARPAAAGRTRRQRVLQVQGHLRCLARDVYALSCAPMLSRGVPDRYIAYAWRVIRRSP